MKIDGRNIGPHQKPYVIAELSANHNGDLDRALKTIKAAKDAGCDAVKFQAYTPDTITINHVGPGFSWKGHKLYDLYQEAHTPWAWFPTLFECAWKEGITAFSSVFDESSVDMLEKLGCPAYKIASFEITDIPLIRYAASTGMPLILSCGMGTWDEIKDARSAAGFDFALLHCVSEYPADHADLWAMKNLFSLSRIVGFSDHTQGIKAAQIAVKHGAQIIEKHITLSRADGGVDAEFSAEPHEFKEMIRSFSDPGIKRSIYAVAPIKKGELFTELNVRSIRPGHGLPPKVITDIIGRRAKRDIPFGEPMQWDMIE